MPFDLGIKAMAVVIANVKAVSKQKGYLTTVNISRHLEVYVTVLTYMVLKTDAIKTSCGICANLNEICRRVCEYNSLNFIVCFQQFNFLDNWINLHAIFADLGKYIEN